MLAAVAVAFVALVATGCNNGEAWIARVNGEAVDSPDFWANVPYFAQYSSTLSQSAPPTTTAGGLSDTSAAANYAMFLVQLDGLKSLNAKHGITVSQDTLAQSRQAFEASSAAAQFKDFPSSLIDQLVAAQANYEALMTYYAKGVDMTAQIAAYYKANKSQFLQVCMDVIGGDESVLAAARSEIEGGASFATVAKAVAGQQPASNGQPAKALGTKGDGDVGCVPVSTLTSLFAVPTGVDQLTQAKAGSLVGPVPVAGGTFMLFRVRSTSTESLADAKATIQQTLGQPGQTQAQKALNTYLSGVHIELNPRVGSWTKGVGYAPPVGAEQPKGATQLPTGLTGATG